MNFSRRHFLHAAAAAGAGPLLVSASAGEEKEKEKPRRIRVGQIGTQHGHAAGKMETMRRLVDQFEVMGIAEGEGRDLIKEAFGGLPVMKREEMLASAEVEAVVVETGMREACATAHAAVKAGKHVHLDKPGALQHRLFATMRKEAEEKKLVFQMGYMLRYNPAFQLMARAVKEGWLGRITEIDAMMGKKLDEAGRRELKDLPGGGMFELGCHLVDAVCWLMGGKPAEVHSFSRPTETDRLLDEDNQVAVLVYPTAVATLRCNLADPFGNPRRRFMITGTEGSMEVMPLESGKVTIRLTAARGEYQKGEQAVTLAVAGRYDAELTAFAEAVRNKHPLPWDAAHDIGVHGTVLRAAGLK